MKIEKKERAIYIVHELPKRLRLRCHAISKGNIDSFQLESRIESVPGVDHCRCNLRAASVVVEYNGLQQTRQDILVVLADLPDVVFSGNGEQPPLLSVLPVAARGVFAAGSFFLPAFIVAPITIILSIPILLEGVFTLWKRGVKIEVLDSSAILFCLIRGDWFTANSIMFLLSLGEYIEEQSEKRSTSLLKSLLKPQVERVWIEMDGQEIEISIDEVKIGDYVVCGSGEMVPLDGVVVRGEATVDTSSITGESIPIPVASGDELLSGSVVTEGRVVIEATRIGADSSMAKISTFLENSLRNPSELEKRSDELANKLVPISFGLGIGLLAATRDLEKAAAVLTVDYSCAIKLVNPVAIRVGMYSGAKQGVLLKGAQAMESLAALDVLVFDKTGTLTRGKLTVTDIVPRVNSISKNDLLVLAASAEEHYSHPVASAVLTAAKEKGLSLAPVSQVDFIVAHGVSAYVDGANALVGSRHFIEDDEGIDCSALDEDVAKLEKAGKSILYIAKDGKFIGIIGLRDELRSETIPVLDALKRNGIKKIVILTGDSKVTAEALASGVDAVDEIHAELKPEDKARIVKELKDAGNIVGFIGDGVNDAPALVSADVGICLPNGADLAKESAQVILLQDDLHCLLYGYTIALHTRETIERSFGAVVALNSSFLLAATFGWLAPVGAALLHNLSTVGVLGYAMLRGAGEEPQYLLAKAEQAAKDTENKE